MRRSLAVLILVAACGGDDAVTPDASPGIDAEVDAMPSPDADPENPMSLRDTGLYASWDDETIASDVYAFTPEPILWSDGATKRRWIYLPPQTTIDTTDMDYWRFPEGTKLWKEFTRDGTRVETRLLQKIGPDDNEWFEVAFAWNEAQDEAIATPLGASNVLETEHDIPGRSQCRQCHDRQPSRILGFSAIALDHPANGNGEIALAEAIAMGWLSNPPVASGGAGADYFPLPGAALDQQALGYMHVNCGGCHNPMTDISTVNLHLKLSVSALGSVDATSVGQTAIDQPNQLTVGAATAVIEPGEPDLSALYLRLSSTNPAIKMPPIGHELVDTDNAAMIFTWIDGLPP